MNSFLKSYKKFGGNTLSLSTLGNTLYFDYSSDICLSGKTQDVFEGIFEKIADSKFSLMLESPFIYTADYADCIIGAPCESSNYDIEDKNVPFYQLLLHGLVTYSLPSANSSLSEKLTVLKAVETGSSIMYSLSATEFSEIIEDGYEELNCIYAKDWLDEIADSSHIVYNALKDVADTEIVFHSEVNSDVFKIEYANGIIIYVNYGEEEAIIDGVNIPEMDFCVCGGVQK